MFTIHTGTTHSYAPVRQECVQISNKVACRHALKYIIIIIIIIYNVSVFACHARQIYKERKHLAFTLADAKSVVARLEAVLGVAAHAAAAIVYLLIFRVSPAYRYISLVTHL
jgi:hypothetical protein